MSDPGREELRASFEAFDAIERYWTDHYVEFLQEYPEQFVAMREGEIIASNPDLIDLVDLLQQRGFDVPKDVSIRFMTTTWATLNLSTN